MIEKYYNNARMDIIEAVPSEKKYGSILEIGGGDFVTLQYLVDKFGSVGVGIDLRTPAVEVDKRISFVAGSIEDEKLQESVSSHKFDLIIAGDVLEHLIDPKKVLLFLKSLLYKDGIIVLSIPNVQNIKTFFNIYLRGTFPREPNGLFDATHRSWFCRKDVYLMCHQSGLQIVRVKPLGRKTIPFLGASKVNDLLALQYLYVVKSRV